MEVGTLDIPAVAEEVAEAIKSGERFLMVPHQHIDGDDLGCMIGLALALKQLNKQVYLYSEDPVPERFRFLEGHELVTDQAPTGTFSAVFILECPDYGRLPEHIRKVGPKKYTNTIITLDHHTDSPTQPRFIGNINWVDPSMSALGEMISLVCFHLGLKLSNGAATALYTSIVSDSQAFRFNSVSPRTHLIVAKLLSCAHIDTNTVHFNTILLRSIAENKVTDMVKATREYYRDNQIVVATLTQDMLEAAGLKDDNELQTLVPDVNTAGAEVFIQFKCLQEGVTRVSLRSLMVPVVSVAYKHNGGGHDLACAMKFLGKQNVEEIKATLVAEIAELLNKAGK